MVTLPTIWTMLLSARASTGDVSTLFMPWRLANSTSVKTRSPTTACKRVVVMVVVFYWGGGWVVKERRDQRHHSGRPYDSIGWHSDGSKESGGAVGFLATMPNDGHAQGLLHGTRFGKRGVVG